MWGVMTGAVRHNLSFTGLPYDNNTITSTHTGFVLGPSLRLGFGRLSEKVSLSTALLLENEKYNLEGPSGYWGASDGARYRSHFNLTYLRLPLMVRYTFPRGKVAPLLEGGFTGAVALKSGNSVEETNRFYNGQYTAPRTLYAPDELNTLQLGIGAGLGLTTQVANGRALSLLLRAEQSSGFVGLNGVSSPVLRFYGLLNFDLTK